MRAENTKWIAYRRNKDDLLGILKYTGPTSNAIEALQRSWEKFGRPTGLTYVIVQGGFVDALCEAAKLKKIENRKDS